MATQQKISVRAKKGFSTENVETVIREYKKTRWAPNSHRIGKPDSLSAWYSIEEMENFLAVAKSNGGDGIKFYYGAFPDNYTAQPEYAGRQTLVMVATKTKITDNGAIADKDIYLEKNGQIKILSGFVPRGCPPTCNPNSEGGMGDLGITIIDKGENGMEII
jgi:hypothetical protein